MFQYMQTWIYIYLEEYNLKFFLVTASTDTFQYKWSLQGSVFNKSATPTCSADGSRHIYLLRVTNYIHCHNQTFFAKTKKGHILLCDAFTHQRKRMQKWLNSSYRLKIPLLKIFTYIKYSQSSRFLFVCFFSRTK